MNNLLHKIAHYKNYIFLILILTTIIYLIANPAILSLKTTKIKKEKKSNITHAKNIPTITPLPSRSTLQKFVLAAATQISLPPKVTTQTPTPRPLPNPPLQSSPTDKPQQTPPLQPIATATPTPTITTPSQPTSTNTQIITLQIQFPNSNINTTLPLKSNENACDLLQDAKDQNKLTSLTFDDSYLSMMHSRYVKEINGYQNNWTFTVNGTAPLGCSLSTPQPNDTIIWKFN